MKQAHSFFIIISILLFGCTSTNNSKESDIKHKKEEISELATKDTIAFASSLRKEEDGSTLRNAFTNNNKQINIIYRGKDQRRIIKATDIFKDIHYVPLETNDVVLLKPNPKRIIYTNKYIYVNDETRMSGPEIFLFTSEGKFIRTIGRRGQGPEDFLTCFRMNVSNQGVVSLTDRSYSSVISYTTEDDFISRIPIKNVPLYDLAYINDSLLLLKSHYDHSGYKYHIINVNTEEKVDSFYPIKNYPYTIYFPENIMTYRNKILVAEYHNDRILEINKDGVKTRYIINVNDKMPPEDFWSKKVATYTEIRDEDKRMKYIGHIPCFAETESTIFLGFRGTLDDDSTQGWAIIDKKTGDHQTFKRIMLAENVVIEPNFFYSQNDGRVVFAISPETILNSGNQEFISQFPGLKEDDNPILMFAKIK